MSIGQTYGNTTITSDLPFFKQADQNSLIRMFHEGENGVWRLGALNAKTDAVSVVGVEDTGTPKTAQNERRIVFDVAGTYTGAIEIERSVDGPDIGFHSLKADLSDTGSAISGGEFTTTIDDPDDNLQVWYRCKMISYTSGTATVTITAQKNGGITGIARITNYNSNQNVDVEVLSRFSDTGETDNWQLGYWSDRSGYPSSVALHGGRLAHAGGANVFLSVSDDYENFDEDTEGDSAPIIKTLGSGPVDNIFYLASLLRLVVGTAGREIVIRSSQLDEVLTPTNNSARVISTQGSENLRAIIIDTKAIFVQRSGSRLFLIGFGSGLEGTSEFSDFEAFELTTLTPDLLSVGVVDMAVQRQPDTRLHLVLSDGTVAILTYEPQEQVVCWTTWSTTNGNVERVAVLPGTTEDAVYYHINRTINGSTKRYLEKWAKESECLGDTGLSWLADCAVTFSDTGRATTFVDAATHLAGENVIVWGDLDTGTTPYVDLSPGAVTGQVVHAVDTGGDLTLTGTFTDGINQGVLGLAYTADWKSTKMAYGAEAGTALSQMAFILSKTHNKGIRFGSDTGHLDDLQALIDNGAAVDPDKIFEDLDDIPFPSPNLYAADARMFMRAQAPRPVTVLAGVPTVGTNEIV